MRHSLLTRRLDVESSRVWDIHYQARHRQEAGEDVILLTVGDPDFETPPAIVDAAENSLRRGRTRYGPTAGEPSLREMIARHHGRTTAQTVSAENVVVFAGAQAAETLHRLGYRGLRAKGLKGRHIEALVAEWRRQGLSDGTIKNRMAHLRWLAKKIGKPGIVRRDNASYGVGARYAA